MTDACNHMIVYETEFDAPLYCDEETVEGSDFCEHHLDES